MSVVDPFAQLFFFICSEVNFQYITQIWVKCLMIRAELDISARLLLNARRVRCFAAAPEDGLISKFVRGATFSFARALALLRFFSTL